MTRKNGKPEPESYFPQPAHHMFGSRRHLMSAYACLVHQGFDLPQELDPLPSMQEVIQCLPAGTFCWMFPEPKPFEYEGIYGITYVGMSYYVSLKGDELFDPVEGLVFTLKQAHVKFEDAEFSACLYLPGHGTEPAGEPDPETAPLSDQELAAILEMNKPE